MGRHLIQSKHRYGQVRLQEGGNGSLELGCLGFGSPGELGFPRCTDLTTTLIEFPDIATTSYQTRDEQVREFILRATRRRYVRERGERLGVSDSRRGRRARRSQPAGHTLTCTRPQVDFFSGSSWIDATIAERSKIKKRDEHRSAGCQGGTAGERGRPLSGMKLTVHLLPASTIALVHSTLKHHRL